MPKADFEELLMVYTRLYKISQVYKMNHHRRRRSCGQDKENRKFYL